MSDKTTITRWLIAAALLFVGSVAGALAVAPIILPITMALCINGKPDYSHLWNFFSESDAIANWRDYIAAASAQDGFAPGFALLVLGIAAALAGFVFYLSRGSKKRVVPNGVLGKQVSTTSISRIIKENCAWDGKSSPSSKKPYKGLCIGWSRHSLIIIPGLHFLAVAPSGSGKSRFCLLPSMTYIAAVCNENLLATDPSLELYVYGHRYLISEGYTVYLLDFENARMGCRWSPLKLVQDLYEEGDVAAAEARCRDIGATLFPTNGSDSDFFVSAAGGIVSAVCYAIAADPSIESEKKHLWSVVKTAISGTVTYPGALKEWLRSFGEDSPVVTMSAAYLSALGKTEASILSSLQDGLQPYTALNIRWLLSASDLDIDTAINTRSAIFLHTLGPGSPTNRIASLFLSQHYEEVTRLGKRRNIRPYWALLDEAHSLPRGAFNLTHALENSRKYGGHYALFLQSISGLNSLVNKKNDETKDSLISNMDVRILYRANDIETAEYFEKLSGHKTVNVRNTGQTQRGTFDRSTSSSGYSEQRVPLWPAGDLLDRNPNKEGVLVVKASTGGRDSGRYEIPTADVSQTFVADMLGTIGSIEFEREVIGRTLDSMEAEAAAKSLNVPVWTPDFSIHEDDEDDPIEEDEWRAWD